MDWSIGHGVCDGKERLGSKDAFSRFSLVEWTRSWVYRDLRVPIRMGFFGRAHGFRDIMVVMSAHFTRQHEGQKNSSNFLVISQHLVRRLTSIDLCISIHKQAYMVCYIINPRVALIAYDRD